MIKHAWILALLIACKDPEARFTHKVVKRNVTRAVHDERIPGSVYTDTVMTDAIWLIHDYIISNDTLVYSNSDGSMIEIPAPFTVYGKDSVGGWVEIEKVP